MCHLPILCGVNFLRKYWNGYSSFKLYISSNQCIQISAFKFAYLNFTISFVVLLARGKGSRERRTVPTVVSFKVNCVQGSKVMDPMSKEFGDFSFCDGLHFTFCKLTSMLSRADRRGTLKEPIRRESS